MTHLLPTYNRLPATFVAGEGAWLITEEGRRILDGISGIGVCSLGHAHPELASALADQAGKLIHAANMAHVEGQEALAAKLCQRSEMSHVFFCNSGAEAIECGLKLARLWAGRQGFDNPKVVVAQGAFHGRTLATLSASDSAKVTRGYEPFFPGYLRVPFGDHQALEALEDEQIAAVLLEPIQGEGGVAVPPVGYFQQVRRICNERNWLMLADEVQTGVGKTGAWFAYQHENILPDVVSLAKALGNGVPIGACLARGDAATLFSPGRHGSTYGGNSLAVRAANTVLDIMQRDQIPQRAETSGQRLRQRLSGGLSDCRHVVAVRGRGMMVGIELDRPAPDLVAHTLAAGALVNVTREKVVRLLPPLIMTDGEIDQLADLVTVQIQALK